MRRSVQNIICLLFLLNIAPLQSNGHQKIPGNKTENDTTLARQYLQEAKTFADSSKYDSAITHYQKAAIIYKELNAWEDYVKACNQIGENLQEKGAYDEALEYLRKALDKGREEFGEQHVTVAESYDNTGNIYIDKGDYDQAFKYYKKALNIRQKVLGTEHLDVADSYNNTGIFYFYKELYKNAIDYYNKANDIYIKKWGEKHEDVAKVYLNIGLAYKDVGDYDQALNYCQKALDINIEVQVPKYPHLVNNYYALGLLYGSRALYDKTLEYYKKALGMQIEKLGADHHTLTTSYTHIGNIYHEKALYRQALECYQKALIIQMRKASPEDLHLAYIYGHFGETYHRMGAYERALEYHQKSLMIFREKLGDNHRHTALMYNNIGAVYSHKGFHNQALEYYQKALAIRIKLMGNEHLEVAKSYSNIGSIYKGKGQYDQALTYFEKALKVLIKTLGKHPQIAKIYHNFGSVYMNKGLYEQALEYQQKALDIQIEKLGSKHPSVAKSYGAIGDVYITMKSYDRALNYYQKVHQINLERSEPSDLELAKSYFAIGVVYDGQNHFEKTFYYYQKSLITLVPGFDSENPEQNPRIDELVHEEFLLTILYSKAMAFRRLYDMESKDIKDLRLSIATYQSVLQLLDLMRGSRKAERSKLFFTEYTYEIYRRAIHTILLLYKHTGDDRVLQQAFTFAERNKAGVLKEVLQESRAKHFAGIPDSLLERERSLKTDLNYYEATIQKQKQNKKEYDTVQVQNLEDRFFDLNREYEALITLFEKEYTRYHELKYDTRTATADDVRQKLPDEYSALIEYVVADSAVYTFAITKEGLQVRTLAIDSVFYAQVDTLNRMLSSSSKVQRYGLSKEYYQKFTKGARMLYQQLLAPLLKEHPELKQLIIIPDGPLAYLPFEILLNKKIPNHTTPGDYRSLPYLLKDYRIRYAYSAKLLLEKQQKTKIVQPYIGFAPEYTIRRLASGTQNDSGLLVSRSSELRARETFVPLGYNQPEVRQARELIGGRAFLAEAANKANYKKEGAEARILHFAGHSRTNDSLPLQSALVFSATDSNDYDFLHAYEVYGQPLKAELAVLSACLTSHGKRVKGEGLMSLARAFRYAGCPSIATSLWSVNDEAAAILMKEFFKQLKAGIPKDEALRLAKLHVLETHYDTHPHYWASFVLLGDDLPVELGSPRRKWWWLGGGGIVLVVLVLAIRFLKRRK